MISKRRLYLTQDNQVVEASHPDANQLLVGAGCEISDALAKKYGIYEDPRQEIEEERQDAEGFHGYHEPTEVTIVIGAANENDHVRIVGAFLDPDDAAVAAREILDQVVTIPLNTALPDGKATGACEVPVVVTHDAPVAVVPVEAPLPTKVYIVLAPGEDGDTCLVGAYSTEENAMIGPPLEGSSPYKRILTAELDAGKIQVPAEFLSFTKAAPEEASTGEVPPTGSETAEQKETPVDIETKDALPVSRETDGKAMAPESDKAIRGPKANKSAQTYSNAATSTETN
ncbi:hypothetical protein CCAX7_14570 [Capsulimonas corticalis]|uniref:Uncharacterized protein n=1 Tax=Capsulimonas corticalis TaxID=2219043 RepID=A0A402CZF5_9BACT|nr:hypothetical protein [Capsulimonas corticalis]BDI29406.1 hypothetical protein CCAX7_14570 [Capsulimonas corticalis]